MLWLRDTPESASAPNAPTYDMYDSFPRLVQPRNAPSPIATSNYAFFKLMLVIDVQFLNASSPIDVQLEMLLFVRFVQPMNALSPIDRHFDRKLTVRRTVQSRKHPSGTLNPGGIDAVRSLVQSLNVSSPTPYTVDGMVMLLRPEPLNTSSPMPYTPGFPPPPAGMVIPASDVQFLNMRWAIYVQLGESVTLDKLVQPMNAPSPAPYTFTRFAFVKAVHPVNALEPSDVTYVRSMSLSDVQSWNVYVPMSTS